MGEEHDFLKECANAAMRALETNALLVRKAKRQRAALVRKIWLRFCA